MATRSTGGGLASAVGYDLKRLHEGWMELFFPRQLGADETVLGKWKPGTATGRAAYRLWGGLGGLVVPLLYPLVLVGFMFRFYAGRLDGTATRLGLLGVVLASLLVWGGLAAVARLRFSAGGFLAVAAAGGVATISAALAVVFARIGGRKTTVSLAYPLGVTALFLPPVVAALYSPALSDVIFPGSTTLAAWLLDHVLAVGGLNTYLRTQYDLEGLAYVGMWFGLAVPLGWCLGSLVTLANVVRPRQD